MSPFTITPSKALNLIPSPIHMNLALNNIPSTAIPLKFSTLFACLPPKIPKLASFRASGIPGRDRVIDFGKFKGKMLGSLPSAYLKWVSKNLRAGDMEEWAKLADQVLGDPVYRDRIEWEAAEKILNGDAASHCSDGNGRNAVTELLEISERFGWDNEDKSGWCKIDFGLLGTSKGGRIPRVAAGDSRTNLTVASLTEKKKMMKEKNEDGGAGSRKQRRERARRSREKTTSSSSISNYVSGGWERRTTGKRRDEEGEGASSSAGPFPGREALLKKVVNRQTF